MTTDQIKRFVGGIGFPNTGDNSGWIQPSILHYIRLLSEGSQYFNIFNQKLFFDYTNSFLKIKNFETTLVSGKFSNWKYYSGGDFGFVRINKGTEGTYTSIFPKLKKFRNPEVGDFLFLQERETKRKILSLSTNIARIDENFEYIDIYFSSSFDISSYIPSLFSLFYVDSERYLLSSSLAEDDSVFLYSVAETNNVADAYIDFSAITTISLTAER